jgi:hypothetical protein
MVMLNLMRTKLSRKPNGGDDMRKAGIGGVGLLSVAMTQSVSGAVVNFDDLTDAVTATVDGILVTTGCNFQSEIGLNACTVVLPNFLATAATANFHFYYALDEPPTSDMVQMPSDLIEFSGGPSTTDSKRLAIIMHSDPDLPAVSPYGRVAENGNFQPIPLPANLPALAVGNTLTVNARSDLGGPGTDVPEPSTALPTIAGVLGLALWTRRKRST